MRTSRKKQWVSVGEAGRLLGRTRLAVLSMIIRGDLIGEDRAGRTFVRRDSLDAMLETRAA